ncbi:hypothetical protein JTB14_001275 [Gonioctena quinquepunctata]|nr:hypothetical protein JTB14_001275 [Gonioctena quinquepunctata]
MSNAEDQRNLPPDKGEHDKDLKFSGHIDQSSAMTTRAVEETKHEVDPKNLGFQIGQTNRELNNDKKSYEAEIESPMEITMKCTTGENEDQLSEDNVSAATGPTALATENKTTMIRLSQTKTDTGVNTVNNTVDNTRHVYTLPNSPETMKYVKKGDEINNPKTKRLEAKKVYDKNNKIVLHPRKRTKTNKDHTDYSSRGESSALESEKERSEISELDEGDSIKGVKSPINSPNSKKNRNRSLKNTPEIDTDEEMGEEQTKYREEIARNRRRALQQNILHFPKFQNFLKSTSLDLGETSPQSQDIPPQTLIIEAQIIQNEAAENPKSTKPASSEPPLDEKTAGIIEKIKEQAKIKEEQTKLREINATKIKMEKQAKIARNKQKKLMQ